jgi:hypothetical protein
MVLATSATAAVEIRNVVAFPTGWEFEVVAEYVVAGDVWDPMQGLAGLRGRPGDGEGQLPDEHLRLRVRFADQSEANNLGPPLRRPIDAAPFFQYGSGRCDYQRAIGERARVETVVWVWPLPPPGPMLLLCEWPRYGIPLTRHEVDATLIRQAAQRAADSWPEARDGGT